MRGKCVQHARMLRILPVCFNFNASALRLPEALPALDAPDALVLLQLVIGELIVFADDSALRAGNLKAGLFPARRRWS